MDKQGFDEGMQVSRDVMGAERVDDMMRDLDDVTRPIHQLIAEYCPGEIWTRSGVPRKTKSMINLYMLGDLLTWDNTSTQHFAVADYALPQRRRMQRTTVAGAIPF